MKVNALVRGILGICSLWGLSPLHAAVKSVPYVPKEFIVYEIEGQRNFVRPGGVVSIYWGDILTVDGIFLKDSFNQVKLEVNAVTSAIGRPKKILETTGVRLDSAVLFQRLSLRNQSRGGPFWNPLSPGGLSFDLVIKADKRTVGTIPLRIIFPQLHYMDLTVNQSQLRVRSGQSLSVRSSDSFKVHGIVTNPAGYTDVTYQMVREKEKVFLQLVRKNILFSTIVLDLER